MALVTESENDAEDFVAACLSELDADTRRSFSNKCLFVRDAEVWHSMAALRSAHVLVAHPKLDLEESGEQLQMSANKKGHGVVIPVSGAWAGGNEQLIALRSPSASMIEATLTECGFKHAHRHLLRARRSGPDWPPANVLFFDRKPAQEKPWTEKLWIYDLRTNKHFTLKESTLKRSDLDDFVNCYFGKVGSSRCDDRTAQRSVPTRHKRTESERFKSFNLR